MTSHLSCVFVRACHSVSLQGSLSRFNCLNVVWQFAGCLSVRCSLALLPLWCTKILGSVKWWILYKFVWVRTHLSAGADIRLNRRILIRRKSSEKKSDSRLRRHIQLVQSAEKSARKY